MAENTEIAWCDHTINWWWGCTKVSPACANCYAEGVDARFHGLDDVRGKEFALGARHWGPDASRLVRIEEATREAFRYQRRAEREGRRFKVFTLSMGDFFEDRDDLNKPRRVALDIMRQTPNLDWLVLTKRPDRVMDCLREARYEAGISLGFPDWLDDWMEGKPPANVWLGTTVEDQRRADERIPALLQVPARVRFLSCEPLLGPVDLDITKAFYRQNLWKHDQVFYAEVAHCFPNCEVPGLDWVICGGESGPKARPMHPDWVRSLRYQCAAAGVPFLFKQWGEWAPDCLCGRQKACPEIKRPEHEKPGCMFHCGKKLAGRLLDGQLHDAFPEVARG